jgi:hypothetical protein
VPGGISPLEPKTLDLESTPKPSTLARAKRPKTQTPNVERAMCEYGAQSLNTLIKRKTRGATRGNLVCYMSILQSPSDCHARQVR